MPSAEARHGRRLRRRPFFGSLRCGAAILVFMLGGSGLAAQSQTPEEVQAELEALRQNIENISRRLEAERARRRSEQAALARIEKSLAAIALDLRSTRTDLKRARERAGLLQTRAQALESTVAIRRATLAEQLQIAYRVGRRSRLKALLNQEDPAEISRVLALHGFLGRARIEAIDALNREIQRLQSVREEQRSVAARLQSLAEQQAAAKADQDQALAQREAALDGLESRIRDQAARLADMREAATELEALLDKLASALADIPPDSAIEPFAELRGRLPMPVKAPVRAAFSDTRSGNVTWQGWLIETEVGTPVQAVAYGRVAYADWLRGYGMMLIIEHGDGFMTLYGQNQSLIAEVGDWVAPEDVVALAGNTGGNNAPGLYFQIRREGQPVDPAGWISR